MFTYPATNLDITSYELRKYFQRLNIVPARHPDYQSFFSDQPPEILLTYEWTTTFCDIKEYLSPENIQSHNTTLDPDVSLKQRIHLMFMLGLCKDPEIPPDLDGHAFFIDILFTDYTASDIPKELEAAELRFCTAPLHIVLATERSFRRAWVLFEIASRNASGKRSELLCAHFLAATDDGASTANQRVRAIAPMIDLDTLLLLVFRRAVLAPHIPYHGAAALAHAFGATPPPPGALADLTALSGFRVVPHWAGGLPYSPYEAMEAADEGVLEAIRARLLGRFGDPLAFGRCVKAACVRGRCRPHALALALWLEAVMWVVAAPIHLVAAAVGFLLAPVVALCCPPSASDVDLDDDSNEGSDEEEEAEVSRRRRRRRAAAVAAAPPPAAARCDTAALVRAWMAADLVVKGVALAIAAVPAAALATAPLLMWRLTTEFVDGDSDSDEGGGPGPGEREDDDSDAGRLLV